MALPWWTRSSAAVGAGALATLAAEVAWVARRDLPSFEGLDASGPVGNGAKGEPLRIVALGDSTLTGPGLDHPDDIWLRQALARLDHSSRPLEVLSLAVGGSRSADVLRQLPAAASHDPDLVVVAVGSNDAIYATPASALARRIESIIVGLRATGAVVAICNIGDLGNLERVPTPLSLALRRRSRSVAHLIERSAARHDGAVLLDVAAADDGFRCGGVFVGDLFHPNRVGHGLWADAALPGLREALGLVEVVRPRR